VVDNNTDLDFQAVLIAAVNLGVAAYRTKQVLGQNRIITFPWALITYWSFFLVLLVISGPFKTFRGFTGDVVYVTKDTIRLASTYVLAFDLVFLATEALVWRGLGGARRNFKWSIARNEGWLRVAVVIYGAFLLGGAALYYTKTRGLGYTKGYVQFEGSNWPSVFLWASAPLITIKALQRKYLVAIACALPFVFFAIVLNVRSFVLFAVVPVMIIIYFQYMGQQAQKRKRRFRAVLAAAAAIIVLVAFSNVVTLGKPDEQALSGLPDSGMVYGMNIVFEMTNKLGVHTGWNSLTLYFENILSPIMKLFQIPKSDVEDTPVYMASLIDGVPKGNAVYFHYPTLWYADAFVSFGLAGVALAALWGTILCVWESLMTRTSVLMALLLPFYTYHAYMLIRGATAGAASPMSYALYIAVLVVLVSAPGELFKHEAKVPD
jgi:hypothetical protein